MTLPTYDEGDRLRLRGHEYVVDMVDYLPRKDRVLQYRLEAVDEDAPPATLKTAHEVGKFSLMVHFEVDPDDVEVSGDEQSSANG